MLLPTEAIRATHPALDFPVDVRHGSQRDVAGLVMARHTIEDLGKPRRFEVARQQEPRDELPLLRLTAGKPDPRLDDDAGLLGLDAHGTASPRQRY